MKFSTPLEFNAILSQPLQRENATLTWCGIDNDNSSGEEEHKQQKLINLNFLIKIKISSRFKQQQTGSFYMKQIKTEYFLLWITYWIGKRGKSKQGAILYWRDPFSRVNCLLRNTQGVEKRRLLCNKRLQVETGGEQISLLSFFPFLLLLICNWMIATVLCALFTQMRQKKRRKIKQKLYFNYRCNFSVMKRTDYWKKAVT